MSIDTAEFIRSQYSALYKARIRPVLKAESVPANLKGKLVVSYHAADFKSRDIRGLKKRYMGLHGLCNKANAYLNQNRLNPGA